MCGVGLFCLLKGHKQVIFIVEEETVVIKGVIEEVIFRNSDNNYTVVALDHNGEYLTAVGKFPHVNAGETVELTGVFTSHSKYGEQFNVSQVKVSQPTTKEGIIKYLSSDLIKGIGPVTAMAIVDKFGESTLDIIEFNPEKLKEVKGVSAKKMKDIAESFSKIKQMQNVVLFLQQYNITTNMSVKIYNTYGSNTELVLKQNPYKLIEDIEGVGFFTADKIAIKMGVGALSPFRFRAGVLHVLKESGEKSGNTFLPKQLLTDEVQKLLVLEQPQDQILEDVLQDLVLDSQIKILEHEGVQIVAQTKYYNMEKIVAETLVEFANTHENAHLDVTEEIAMFEHKNKLTMHEHQKDAVQMSVNNCVSVITGGPGTGKTTIVKCMLDIFKNQGKIVKLLAPTGRAAKRMNESTGYEASTIHRALEVDFNNRNMFYYNNQNKLQQDVFIIDEVSMVDVQLFFFLLRAIKRGSTVVLVGDKDQLPSVGAGNVLRDVLESGVVPVVQLTQIYRQSKKSLIITNAHLINEGHMPVINNSESTDFFFYEEPNAESALTHVLQMQSERIPKFMGLDSTKIQVLAPMKAGACGVDNLNRQLQQINNPPSPKKLEIGTDRVNYRVGDRVMQITNNYEREWKRDYENGSGVFNGDIGVVLRISPTLTELDVLFEDGRVATYGKGDLNELMLSYAITIHKSQGSEFDVVILPILSGPPMLLTKNLLYTAVTRAKKMVVLIGNKYTINRMVHNNYTSTRYSLLKRLLLEGFEAYKNLIS